jgi:hypothetical protein
MLTIVEKNHIGLFQGKKAKYNELVLKALYEKGYLTSWEIAKEIAKNDPTRKSKNWHHEAQKILSVLVRKDGRLPALMKKGFIEEKNKGFCLTFNKGFCSALVLYKDVPKPAIDEIDDPRLKEIFPELREFMEVLSRIQPEPLLEQYRIMREITFKLLEKGLNFDVISNKAFNNFFNYQFEENSIEYLKKERKNEQKFETPPELKEVGWKLISRLVSMCQKQVKELEDLRNSYNQDNQKAETK